MTEPTAARGDTAGAVQAMDPMPSTSRGFLESRRQRARHHRTLAGSTTDEPVRYALVDQANAVRGWTLR